MGVTSDYASDISPHKCVIRYNMRYALMRITPAVDDEDLSH